MFRTWAYESGAFAEISVYLNEYDLFMSARVFFSQYFLGPHHVALGRLFSEEVVLRLFPNEGTSPDNVLCYRE